MIKQMRKVEEAQVGLGVYFGTNIWKRIMFRLRMVSSLVTWSLEHAIETADAMRSRGYGIKPRTSFTIFRFRLADLFILLIIIVLFVVVATGEFLNIYAFSFYPHLSELSFGIKEWTGYIIVLILGTIPIIIEGRDEIKWRFWKSKI
jgi:energy-coupling factor transport system permease protein